MVPSREQNLLDYARGNLVGLFAAGRNIACEGVYGSDQAFPKETT